MRFTIGGANHRVLNFDKDKLITWIPGVFESVDTPDPQMSFEGRRFLGTQSKRNWALAYPGQQTLTGSVTGIVLLNGWPLRFPIGKITTIPQADTGSADLTADAQKGDMFITMNSTSGYTAGAFICIYDFVTGESAGVLNNTKTAEVNRIDTVISGTVLRLTYPLQHKHLTDSLVKYNNSSTYYDHEIVETVELDTMSWNVHMLDSGETAANAFNRRYMGGMVDSGTISAEEGGMVTMSWDGVQFLNMVHNQEDQATVSTNIYSSDSTGSGMPRYALNQAIDAEDVMMVKQTQAAANDTTGYPTTEPYYFSDGTIKFFDQEFARIRSFSLSISNSIEPRYYIGKRGARQRGPYEIKEGAREYTMSCSVALPDTIAASATTATGATELFKQLLLEGDYGTAAGRIGMTASLKFERGSGLNDYIIIDIPTSATGTRGAPPATTGQLNSQGIFITTAPHPIGTDNPYQVDLDLMFRGIKIWIRDTEPLYP